jgi:DnaJ-class molecular chaperone
MKDFEKKNYYELLGVERDANEDVIRQSFKEIAVVYHPDSNFFSEIVPENEAKEQDISLFKAITVAYQTLINKERRAEYDKELNKKELSRGVQSTGEWIRPDGTQLKEKPKPRERAPTISDLQKLQKQYQERQNQEATKSMAEMINEKQKGTEAFKMAFVWLGIAFILFTIIIIVLFI